MTANTRELSESSTGTSTCIWQQDGEGSDLWQTSCHQAFTINDGLCVKRHQQRKD